ncbi:LysR family transcriptional regulator [Clostridium sp. 19966]|uniref:LysR family transcriptional regulator n=1 Tax=Clostridium sp. 19966 TaxID=2768166 RepID=UPI0028DE4EA7|nr:LysR family transcriptional regulator [Clostridium sp. 19966]MDT8717595.1 LysR family transcriptional regulator [Clostridium sp. 19966]
MTLRHLKIFLCVCKEKNMTLSAEKLYMTQPSVSQAIVELEKHYETKLFERLGKKLYITEAGKKLMAYASHMINLHEEMEKSMLELHQNSVLRIGASVTVGTCVLPDIIKSFKQQYGGTVNVIVDNTTIIENMILKDEIDLALVEGNIHNKDIVVKPFMEDELILVCSKAHVFSSRKSIKLEELEDEAFILREKGSGTRELFESVLTANNITFNKVWECNNTEAIKNAVERDLGISVISKRFVEKEIGEGILHSINIKSVNFKRNFKIVYHKNKFISNSMDKFINSVLK